jgi:hypothetical protein
MKISATEQAIAALRSAARFADYIAEALGAAVEMNKEETLCVTV